MIVLGIDVGGSGIKGALVDTTTGELVSQRLRFDTPQPSVPTAIIEAMGSLVKKLDYQGPIGVGFPAIIDHGVVRSAANIAQEWLDYPAQETMTAALGCEVTLLNDADAAGLAAISFGYGRDRPGVVLVFTLGTGIGSALFLDGRLAPNLELGHLYLPGHERDAEYYAADSARKREKLSWAEWAGRLNHYLGYIEFLFSPSLIILGGGVSKKHDEFIPYLNLRTEVVPAKLRNEAGIVGAAMAAAIADPARSG
jgi:polyphosphate glucokinase